MARFHFSLEPVLNYRTSLEEKAREELAGSLAKYHQEKQVLEQVAEDLAAHSRPANCGRLNLEELVMLENYQRFLEEELEKQTARVQAADKQLPSVAGNYNKKCRSEKR